MRLVAEGRAALALPLAKRASGSRRGQLARAAAPTPPRSASRPASCRASASRLPSPAAGPVRRTASPGGPPSTSRLRKRFSTVWSGTVSSRPSPAKRRNDSRSFSASSSSRSDKPVKRLQQQRLEQQPAPDSRAGPDRIVAADAQAPSRSDTTSQARRADPAPRSCPQPVCPDQRVDQTKLTRLLHRHRTESLEPSLQRITTAELRNRPTRGEGKTLNVL